jgi:hypothetical protein
MALDTKAKTEITMLLSTGCGSFIYQILVLEIQLLSIIALLTYYFKLFAWCYKINKHHNKRYIPVFGILKD